ncbi:5'-3' exonuclease [Rathayibacter sp. YIM 133350]|uniref:5'-3' exonuclease n=1 Tax=Rathayibacter sp. YIM 133350 TaxID=3131992 RepID=UPI00307F4ECA
MTAPLMLLDTASLYFRAFYGIPDTIKAPNGMPVNAVRGLLEFIARLVTEYEPGQLVACWDDDWRPAWRVELIPSYKAHRVERAIADSPDVEQTPDLLLAQIPLIRQVLDGLGIPVLGAAEHEADDVIGSLAAQASEPVDVVTGDRDLFQLVDDASGVRVLYTARGVNKLEVLTDEVVRAKYGVEPRQYADFAVMRGDASDGLPGVGGIGEKTAAALLAEHGSLDAIIAASTDAAAGMSATMRSKIAAAGDYLKVAPRVVEVVRDLDLGEFDARIRPLPEERVEALTALAAEWNLGGAMTRALRALGNEPE